MKVKDPPMPVVHTEYIDICVFFFAPGRQAAGLVILLCKKAMIECVPCSCVTTTLFNIVVLCTQDDRSGLETSATHSKSMLLNRMGLKLDRSNHVISRYRPIKIDNFTNGRNLKISAAYSKSMLLNRMGLKLDRSNHVINRYRPIKIDNFAR